jgi:hypothetical protein
VISFWNTWGKSKKKSECEVFQFASEWINENFARVAFNNNISNYFAINSFNNEQNWSQVSWYKYANMLIGINFRYR